MRSFLTQNTINFMLGAYNLANKSCGPFISYYANQYLPNPNNFLSNYPLLVSSIALGVIGGFSLYYYRDKIPQKIKNFATLTKNKLILFAKTAVPTWLVYTSIYNLLEIPQEERFKMNVIMHYANVALSMINYYLINR